MNLSRFRERLLGGDAGDMFRGMLKLALGTGMGRLIGIASIPVLARIYSPADYGVLSVYGALVAVIAPILTLRYVMALPLPRTDAMAVNLLALSGGLMLVTGLLITVLFWALGDVLLSWMSMDILAPWWWLVVLGSLAVALYEALSLWATRERAYGIIARTKVVQSVTGEAAKLLLGWVGFKPFGLLFGHVVTQSGGIGAFSLQFWPDFKRHWRKVSRPRLRLLARYYQGFPTFRLVSQFLLVFSMQAPAMFSAALYGAEVTGQLGMALMALALPSNLIGTAVGQAFYGEIARLKKGSEVRIKELATQVQKRLLLAGIIPTLMIIFFGELIFRVAFGAKWSDAGEYASILAPYILLQLTSAPLIQILNIYRAQGAFLAMNICRTFGLVGIYLFSEMHHLPPMQFAVLLGGFLFVFYLVISIYIFHVVNRAARQRDESTGGQDAIP